MKPEEAAACDFVKEFQLRWPAIWAEGRLIHIPNEAGARGKDLGAFLGMIAKRRKMGMVDGCSDYFLAYPIHGYEPGYSGLFLEFKAEAGTLKPTQLAFLEAKLPEYACAVAWGAEGAIAAVRTYLATEHDVNGFWSESIQGFVKDQRAPIAAFTLAGKIRRTKK